MVAKEDALAADQATYIKHLNDLTASLNEIQAKLTPTVAKFQSKELDTSKGLSFLEAKYLVMLEYITSLGFVMHRKLEGGSIQGMPAVHSLIEQRTILEKIKPVEQKLKYQIDKLVRAAIIGQNPEAAAALRSSSSTTTPTLTVQQQRQLQEDGETTTSINAPSLAGAGGPLMTDPLAFRPNPKGLVAEAMEGGDQDDEQGAEGDDDDEGKEGKVYRAPKMVPVHFEEDSSAVAKRLKYQARLQARAAKSRVMRDLVNELDDRPEEVSLDNDGVHYGMGLDDKQKERERYEEDNFTRTMLSKKELQRLRKGNMPRFENEFENLNDFAQMAPLQDDLESSELLRRNVMQRRKDRKVAAAAEMDRSDSDDDMGASRKRSRNTGGRDAFDGLMSDPRKRAKGRTAFDRSKRNLNRKKGRK
ncbi:hypothetical protein DFQ26_002487 [Actinomortierella ambigua]|nr:hypothetical protein DFQ26_002487 [Actinomortierella ambigua]